MRTTIFAYSDKGCELAKKISCFFLDSECYTTEKLAKNYGFIGADPISSKVGDVFSSSKQLVFIGACGIAVRAIAPYIKNKAVDPAVVVIDDCGNFVISLISGHIGGANEFAVGLAKCIGATPVITTATDVNNKFSVDSWAVKNSFVIGSMKIVKDISAKILVEDISFKSDVKVKGALCNGLAENNNRELGIYVSYKLSNPFISTLHLIPKCIHVGMGCKKNIEFEKVENLFISTLKTMNIDLRSIKSISSIDLKKDENAILKLASKYELDTYFYSSNELEALDGDFTKSEFVKSITGVDNVCERAAYKSSKCGEFITKKVANNGVTIAVCIEYMEVSF